MKEIIEQEITKDLNYLLIEGDNEQDHSYFEGKIAGMRWVLTQLEKEGESNERPKDRTILDSSRG
jgi:hypothetical protein